MLLVTPLKKQTSQEIYIQYILQKYFLKLSEEEQNYINKAFIRYQFNSNQPRSYGISIIYHINQIFLLIKSNIDRIKITSDKHLNQKFKNFQAIIKNYIQPNLSTIQHPRIIILALEQSQIFRQFSLLVKVMNNSIFSTIRKSKNKTIFYQICKFQHYLSIKCNKQSLENHILQIQNTIEEFFKYLVKNQIVFVQYSFGNQSNGNKNNDKTIQKNQKKSYTIGQLEVTSIDRKYTVNMHVFENIFQEFSEKLFRRVTNEALNNYIVNENEQIQILQDKRYKNEFIIQYISSKGIISIKYVTPIQLNIENSDIITFQSNNISYFLSNLTMEIIDKNNNKNNKKKQKQLVIKTLSYINANERPLFKIILMMDLVMLCGKISEPQFAKKVINGQDYKRMQQISLKVQHMIRLFVRKIQKFYKVISQAQSKNTKSW